MNRPAQILLVDDKQDILLLCRLNLEVEGYEVVEARGGARALELIAQEPPDLVILDVMMPDMDGWQVLSSIREDPRTTEVPVIMLTAKAQERDQIHAWQLGATGYLTKPFSPEELLDAVRDALLARSAADVKERSRREIARLRLRAEDVVYQLAAIVESSSDAIISTSVDGTILSWNRAACEIYGFTAEEAVGRPVSILVPRDRGDQLRGILERIVRGERVDHYETVGARRDGKQIHVSLTVSAINDSVNGSWEG